MSIGMELLERTIGPVAHGHDSIIRVAMGKPAERLSIFAASLGAEMVVVGSRRRHVFRARRLGSVSRSLIGLCECPVLVVSPAPGCRTRPWTPSVESEPACSAA